MQIPENRIWSYSNQEGYAPNYFWDKWGIMYSFRFMLFEDLTRSFLVSIGILGVFF